MRISEGALTYRLPQGSGWKQYQALCVYLSVCLSVEEYLEFSSVVLGAAITKQLMQFVSSAFCYFFPQSEIFFLLYLRLFK